MSPYQWELDRIAAALTATMPDLCDVYRKTGNRDRYGGDSAEALVQSDLAISVTPVQSSGPYITGVESDVVVYNLAFPRGTFLREGDIVEVITLGGIRLTVQQVQRGESWDTMVRAQASRITSNAVTT